MKDDRPILVVDYCRVADKYEFLASLARELAPRTVHVVDGYRGRRPILGYGFEPAALYGGVHSVLNGSAAGARGPVEFHTPPRGVFHRRPFREIFLRARAFAGMEEERFRELAGHLTALTLERRAEVAPDEAAHRLIAAHRYTEGLMKRLDPALTIVWNQFHPLSLAAGCAVRRSGGRLAYIEYGLLPGTLNFDFRGQMGESAVACDAGTFEARPIDDADRAVAAATLARLKASRANRRVQPALGRTADRLRARAGNRPIVLFAGHNDHAAGVIPYDDNARRHHSPVFESSGDAAKHLGELARREGWFVVYKPHPFASRSQDVTETEDLAVLGKVDINDCIDLADCVVTILSQASYVTLIREKPLVMLGYNQLRDRDCFYRAETLDEVAPAIGRALAEGYTSAQRAAAIDHVAHLLKYYLYTFDGAAPLLDEAGTVAALADRIETAIETDTYVDF
jgi:hypothetical protein